MLFLSRMLQARRPLDAGLTPSTEEHVLSCVRKQRRSSGLDVGLCVSITERTSNRCDVYVVLKCVCSYIQRGLILQYKYSMSIRHSSDY